MRAQQIAAIQPERVLHVARRMVGRDVEGVEVVVFVFHFGTVEDRESQRAEQLFELALDARDGMQMAAPRIWFLAARACSMFWRTLLSSLPKLARSAGGSLPISLPACASGPLRPSASTRTASNSSTDAAAAMRSRDRASSSGMG